jgi:hypothetical protein
MRFFNFRSVEQFLDRRRTQFEFTDYDHIQSTLLRPMGAGGWRSWDAS